MSPVSYTRNDHRHQLESFPRQLSEERGLARFLLLIIHLFGILFAIPSIDAQVAVRIPDKALECRGMARLTRTGVASDSLNTKEISPDATELWIATSDGVYVIQERSSTYEKLQALPLDIRKIVVANKLVWLSAPNGIIRVNPADRHGQVILPGVELNMAVETKAATWLLTSKGVYRVALNSDTANPIEITRSINCLAAISDGQVLLGADDGIYITSNDGPVAYVAGSPRDVHCLTVTPEHTWVGTKSGIFSFDGPGVFSPVQQPSNTPATDVSRIYGAENVTWFVAGRDIFLIVEQHDDSGRARLVAVPLGRITQGNIKGVQYLKTTVGSSLSENFSTSDKDKNTPREFLLSQELWVGTDEGLFLYQDGQKIKTVPDKNMSVSELVFSDGHPWVATDKGVFRVDRDVSIKFDLRQEDSWWKSIVEVLFQKQIRVSGIVGVDASYVQSTASHGIDGTDPYDSSIPRHFAFIMEMDRKEFNRAIQDKEHEYSLAKNLRKELNWGTGSVFYDVRDQWDNSFEGRMPVIVMPGPLLLSAFLVPAWALSLILIIIFAPHSVFCMNVLMNKNIRKYGYFNLVPIIITVVPPIRSHVLRRYFDALKDDSNLTEWQNRYVVPSDIFVPAQSFEALVQHRKLILLGQSGIGKTSYFKYLISTCLLDANIGTKLRRLVPIFLPLNRYRNTEPAEMIHTQLASYGQLTDSKVTLNFLDTGGFLIFFDGLNDLDADARNALTAFVERYWLRNYFFMSSQEDYPEFGAQRVQLEALNRGSIQTLLSKRLPEDRVDRILSTLDADMYELYKVPQELELAIELLIENSDETLPRTRQELYEKKLLPVFGKWKREGQSEFCQILIARTYQALRAKEIFFDPQPPKASLPDEIKRELVKAKLLVPRLDQYCFSHDQIRAFLAAKYIAPRWRELFKEADLTIDFSWQSTLRFTIGYMEGQENELRDILLQLISKDKLLAIELFKWLNETNAKITESWSSLFTRNLGEAMVA